MMMTLIFFLLSEPGEGGCFASWTSAENSLPDNHLALSLLSDAPLTAQGRLLNGHETSASIPSIVIKLGR